MRPITKRYTNGEVTVVWKHHLCSHVAICFTELPEVFDPLEKPWININGATTERIIEIVKKCPTGALTYYMNNIENENQNDSTIPEKENMVKVEILKYGPIIVRGKILFKDSDGVEVFKEGTMSLCRCGKSANQPFCDGSHMKK